MATGPDCRFGNLYPTQGGWLGAAYTTSALPSGRGHISFGLSLLAVGTATVDDFPYARDM